MCVRVWEGVYEKVDRIGRITNYEAKKYVQRRRDRNKKSICSRNNVYKSLRGWKAIRK